MTSAAKELYISQPAISKSVKNLENLLGLSLFNRTSKGVELTEEGQVLYEHISKAIHEIKKGEEQLEKRKINQKNLIKIGVSTSMCKFFLLQHIQKFQKSYPHIQLQIINKSTCQTLTSLTEGTVDIGINCFPFDTSNYETIKLFDIEDIFVANKYYINKIGTNRMNLDVLSKHPLFLLNTDSIARESIDKYFQVNNIKLAPQLETENMDFIIQLAKSNAGIACVIKQFIEEDLKNGSFVEIPITPAPPTRQAGIIFLKNHSLDSNITRLINHLKSVSQSS